MLSGLCQQEGTRLNGQMFGHGQQCYLQLSASCEADSCDFQKPDFVSSVLFVARSHLFEELFLLGEDGRVCAFGVFVIAVLKETDQLIIEF